MILKAYDGIMKKTGFFCMDGVDARTRMLSMRIQWNKAVAQAETNRVENHEELGLPPSEVIRAVKSLGSAEASLDLDVHELMTGENFS